MQARASCSCQKAALTLPAVSELGMSPGDFALGREAARSVAEAAGGSEGGSAAERTCLHGPESTDPAASFEIKRPAER